MLLDGKRRDLKLQLERIELRICCWKLEFLRKVFAGSRSEASISLEELAIAVWLESWPFSSDVLEIREGRPSLGH